MDEKLLDAIELMAEGKEEGFNIVYSATYNHVYFRAKSYMKTEEDALDLVQIVYVEAYKNIKTLQTPEALYGWLDSITYRQGMKQYRKQKEVLLTEEGEGIFETLENVDVSSMPEQTADQKETSKIIRDLMEELPALQKVAMIAYYFDNLSVGQIAEMQECSKGTVQSRLNYGRKYLKDRIEEKEKKEGYRLHVFTPATLYFAIKMLANETNMSVQTAQSVYYNTCMSVGVTSGSAIGVTATVIDTTGKAVGTVDVVSKVAGVAETAGKAVGIGGKIASLSTGMKAVVMAGTLAVGTASIGGVAYVATHPLEQEVMQETENSETEEENITQDIREETTTQSMDEAMAIEKEQERQEEVTNTMEEETGEQILEEEIIPIQLSDTEKMQITDAIAYYDSMVHQLEEDGYVSSVRGYLQNINLSDGTQAMPLGWNSDVVTEETVKTFYEDGFGISIPEGYSYNDFGVTCNSELMWESGFDRFRYDSLDIEDNGDGTYTLHGSFYWEAEGESDLYTFEATAVESGNPELFGGLKIVSYTVE